MDIAVILNEDDWIVISSWYENLSAEGVDSNTDWQTFVKLRDQLSEI